MNIDNIKRITIEETVPNEDGSTTVISSRRFKIKKFNAKISIKMVKLLSAKILPIFDQLVPLLTGENDINVQEEIQKMANGDLNGLLSLESIAKALDLISDEDLDKIMDTSLRHCYEILEANEAQILNTNGTYGVPNIEDDAILVMRLTVEAVWLSVSGFFNVSRLSSHVKPLGALFRQSAAM